MNNVLLGTGLACLVAAVIGGGLKAFGLEIPVLTSLRRQIALGLLGVILLVFAVVNPGSLPPQSKPQSAVAPAPGPLPAVDERESGPISLSVNSSPRTVAPGGSTTISVLATASDGTPLVGALVSVSAGGGAFEATGALKFVGRTDEHGVFHATWHTYEASAYTGDMSYVIGVEATKEGMTAGAGQVEVFVRK